LTNTAPKNKIQFSYTISSMHVLGKNGEQYSAIICGLEKEYMTSKSGDFKA
jgi:hypothetical protein